MNSPAKKSISAALRDDRGASPISVILLLMAALMFADLIVMGGRLASAQGDVFTAARQAARTASVSAGPATAPQLAEAAALANLQGKGPSCTAPTVDIETGDFENGGSVKATVTCAVQLGDLGFLSAPWPTIEIDADAVEIIEKLRAVS